MGGGSWAPFFGGLGLILLAREWIGSGAGGVLRSFSTGISARARDPLRALAAGGLLSASLAGGRETPSIVRRLGLSRGLSSAHVAMLCVGSSGGALVVAVLALLVSLGPLLPAAALLALFAAALAPLARRSWLDPSRVAGGWALAILGLAVLQSGWERLAPASPALLGAQSAPGALLLCALAAGAAWFVRSPLAICCLAVQGSAAGALHVGAGLAVAAGAALGSIADSLVATRCEDVRERSVAVAHLVFCALWAGLVMAVLLGLSRVLGILSGIPGGPGVTVLAVLLLAGVATAASTLACGDFIEGTVRARTGPSATGSTRLEWHGAPEVLAADLRRILGEAAAATVALAREVLGADTSRTATRERALELPDTALTAIDRLMSRHGSDTAPLRVGCLVGSARRAAQTLQSVTALLLHPPESPMLGIPDLDLQRTRARLCVAQLAEQIGGGHEDVDPQAWDERLAAARTFLAGLWDGALSASAYGYLGPFQLGTLRPELDRLEALASELDRYTREVTSLARVRARGVHGADPRTARPAPAPAAPAPEFIDTAA